VLQAHVCCPGRAGVFREIRASPPAGVNHPAAGSRMSPLADLTWGFLLWQKHADEIVDLLGA
jgi:hypothetical protein